MSFTLQPWQARRVFDKLTDQAKCLRAFQVHIGNENGDRLPRLIERAIEAVDDVRRWLYVRAGSRGEFGPLIAGDQAPSARLTHAQFRGLTAKLFPLANYVVRLKERMGRLPFRPDDQFFRLVLAAQDVLQHLAGEIHYAGCNHGVGRGEAGGEVVPWDDPRIRDKSVRKQ